MAASGLNRAEREIVVQQVANDADGGYVRNLITKMTEDKRGTSRQRDGWDYEANIRLCSWLSSQGYVETARHLEKKINDHS